MEQNNITLRLKELRASLKMSQTDFGKRLGKNYHSVMRWELGKVLPPSGVIDLICSIFKVNRTWLETGTGQMFAEAAGSILSEPASKQYCADKTSVKILASPSEAGKNFPVTSGEIYLPGLPSGALAFYAGADSASPVMQGDIVVFVPYDNELNKDGELCVVRDPYGTVTIRWVYPHLGTVASKRPEYPDTPMDGYNILGIIRHITREISF